MLRAKRPWRWNLCALSLVRCKTIDLLFPTSLESQECYLTTGMLPYKHSRFFSAIRTALQCCRLASLASSLGWARWQLNPLPGLVALKILRDIISFTRSFMINTRPLVGCLENSDRNVKRFRVIPRIASSRLVYSSSIQCPEWMCLVLQRGSRFVPRNCHATDIALSERLGSNGF